MAALAYLTATTSVLLRTFTYIFLRWAPGQFLPPAIFTLFAVWVTTFYQQSRKTSAWEVLDDEINVVIRRVNDEAKRRELQIPSGQPLEELDVEETLVMVEKNPQYFRTLLLGTPSPSRLYLSMSTLALNLLFVYMVWDMTYRASMFYPATDLSFSRLGYVSDTTAKVFIREPNSEHLPLLLSYRFADSPGRSGATLSEGIWKAAGTVYSLTNETDYTTTLTINGLQPDTRYQYLFSNNQTGFLVTAPPAGTYSTRPTSLQKFTFLHTSCVIPRFPYNLLHHPLHVPGFSYLSPWLALLKPSFMLFLGDWIYIDVPRRHGRDVATYRRAFRQIYASPSYPTVTSTTLAPLTPEDPAEHHVPWLHVYDDHEIANDWRSNTTAPFPAAFDPYLHYQVHANPPSARAPARSSSSLWPFSSKTTPAVRAADAAYFSFTHGPAAFFMLDTRRFRTAPNTPDASMLGAAQLADLVAWLAAPPPQGVRWKFIVSSVPLTKNWPVNNADTWGGFLAERRVVLGAAWDSMYRADGAVRVVFLSGDRHEFAATAFPPPKGHPRWTAEKCTVVEYSTSPLDMFYGPVKTYRQVAGDEEDVMIEYINVGNHKFGAVEITEGDVRGESKLRYRLFVEGRERWVHELVAARGAYRWERWL